MSARIRRYFRIEGRIEIVDVLGQRCNRDLRLKCLSKIIGATHIDRERIVQRARIASPQIGDEDMVALVDGDAAARRALPGNDALGPLV